MPWLQARSFLFPELSSFSSTAIIKAETLSILGEERPVKGKFELRLPGDFHLAYGDRLKLEGSLRSTLATRAGLCFISCPQRHPDAHALSANRNFRSGKWQSSDGIALSRERRRAAFLVSAMPVQESSLFSGILLGIDWDIPGYLESAYRTTGTVHIIAISGFNIALITGLVIRLFRRIFKPVWAGILASQRDPFLYLLVGAEPSVVRAAIMGSLSIRHITSAGGSSGSTASPSRQRSCFY